MRSLFLKIFLWFWVTQVLIFLAMTMMWTLQPELVVSRWRASTGDAVALYAQSAAEEADRYGATALNNYLQRLETTSKIRASLLDDNLQPVGGKVSPAASALAQQARSTGQREFDIQHGTAYAAQRVAGPSGRNYVFVAQMSRGPLGAFRPTTRTMIVRWILSALISGIICYLLTLYLTRPILRLRTATRQLAEGDLSARAGEKMERRRDELGDLVRDFNVMAGRIETLLTSQRQLISDISHELRSPLARLNVALGLARQRVGEGIGPQLDRIEREAERLNEMIGQLLTLARMQAASGPPQESRIQLDELVREVAADAAYEAQQRHCNVRVLASEPCSAFGSPELLRSAIENVVRNAVRYTAEGSEVEIALRNSSGRAEITVRDHGPGVPEAELPNLFRPFYRVANARERQTGGTGLGLAITDRAVRLHGGSVHLENARDGGGLRVVLRIPAVC